MKATKKKLLTKLAEIERRLAAGAALDIVVMQTTGQKARVGYGAGGLFITMPADQARSWAEDFRTDEARSCGADQIGRDLAEAADVCDMHNASGATRQ